MTSRPGTGKTIELSVSGKLDRPFVGIFFVNRFFKLLILILNFLKVFIAQNPPLKSKKIRIVPAFLQAELPSQLTIR